MRTTIDVGGRVVIPKAIRDRLGLAPGQHVEVVEHDGRVEVEPAPTPMSLADGAAVPEGQLPALTDDIVRETLEKTRR
jgi:AbrB family looped-hinge helix DNA binding protein